MPSTNLTMLNILALLIFLSPLLGCSDPQLSSPTSQPLPQLHDPNFSSNLESILRQHSHKSGAYVLEKGEESLLARAWLTEQATRSIDVQYFIWSTDNIGILAAESLLRAAERGVKVRILVDDLLIDADSESLLAMSVHPNIQIRIYNPRHKVGTSFLKRLSNIAFGFRKANQRMHNKTFVVDNQSAITGGRNLADEYFDFDHKYNFRDRDILLLGPVAKDIDVSFESFWRSNLSIPVETLLRKNIKRMTTKKADETYRYLHAYSRDLRNYDAQRRQILANLPKEFASLLEKMVWDDVRFISDAPGKNSESVKLGGGGITTDILIQMVRQAQKKVVIQTPYLVLSNVGLNIFKELVERKIEVKIITNSLASTDNLQAYSGYSKKKESLLKLGLEIYEYKPFPSVYRELFERNREVGNEPPVFALHAKTMVVDGEHLYIGTFNLDPRSANLNTEVGVVIHNKALASKVEKQMEEEMLPENSWEAHSTAASADVGLDRRMALYFWQLLPLDPIL